MSVSQFMIIFVSLVVAAAFLYIWKRRDTEGQSPDSRPDA